MDFEKKKSKRPDYSVKARNKDTGETVSIGAAWNDDRFVHPYLRFDRDIDFIVVVMNSGEKVKITTGMNGTHNVRLYRNEAEDKERTFGGAMGQVPSAAGDDFDFSDL